MLEKFPLSDFVLEGFFIKKVVVFPVFLTWARSTGCARDVSNNGRELMGQLIDKGGFPSACRSADDKDESLG